jgi:hypothetical protein
MQQFIDSGTKNLVFSPGACAKSRKQRVSVP